MPHFWGIWALCTLGNRISGLPDLKFHFESSLTVTSYYKFKFSSWMCSKMKFSFQFTQNHVEWNENCFEMPCLIILASKLLIIFCLKIELKKICNLWFASLTKWFFLESSQLSVLTNFSKMKIHYFSHKKFLIKPFASFFFAKNSLIFSKNAHTVL